MDDARFQFSINIQNRNMLIMLLDCQQINEKRSVV